MKKLVELLTLAVHVSKSASQDWLVINPPGLISETASDFAMAGVNELFTVEGQGKIFN